MQHYTELLPGEQQLMYSDRQIADEKTMAELGVKEGSTIQLSELKKE